MQDIHMPTPVLSPRPNMPAGIEPAAKVPSRKPPASEADLAAWNEMVKDLGVECLSAQPETSEQQGEPAAPVDVLPALEESEEQTIASPRNPPLKAPTFAPSTRMETGKMKWGTTRFVAIPHALVTHEGFSELSGRACKLLLAMLSQYVGNNNGHLKATQSLMRRFGFNSKDSLAKSIQELIVLGYIVRTRSQQRRDASLYAITWFPTNKAPAGTPYDAGIKPTDEASDRWRHIDPLKAKGMAAARKLAGSSTSSGGALH